MKIIKNCLFALAALFFVTLGAAMPYLASRMQDARLSGFQKKSELNSVNLTLQQKMENVIPALEMISKDYTETLWKGKTALSESDAQQSAFEVLAMMSLYGLPPERIAVKSDGSTEAVLLIAEDGSSALVWMCTWNFESSLVSITVDDATGKAVRMIETHEQLYDDVLIDDIYIGMESWLGFLQDYYDGFIDTIEELGAAEAVMENGSIRRSAGFVVKIYLNDGSGPYDFDLEIASDYTFFNYK